MRNTGILVFIAGRISKFLGHEFGLYGIVDKTMPDNHRKISVQVLPDRICMHVCVTYNNVEYKTTHVFAVYNSFRTHVISQDHIHDGIVSLIESKETNYFEFYDRDKSGIVLLTDMEEFPAELIDLTIGELLA